MRERCPPSRAGLLGTATILATIPRDVHGGDWLRIAWCMANPHDGALPLAICCRNESFASSRRSARSVGSLATPSGVARALIKSVACSGSRALASRFLSIGPPGREGRRRGAGAASLQEVPVGPERPDRESETSVRPCV